MVAIIDYDTGNLRSVINAVKRLGAESVVTSDHEVIRRADHVLLPGVGEASSAMEKLRQRRLDVLVPSLTQPVLGICIGMQLMCRSSQEGDAQCMGIFPAEVRKIPKETANAGLPMAIKVPHMGWDQVRELRSPLFADIKDGSYFYFVHSYAPELCADTIAVTDYGMKFSAALGRANFYGTQFHPEKSGSLGERLLRNFLEVG